MDDENHQKIMNNTNTQIKGMGRLWNWSMKRQSF